MMQLIMYIEKILHSSVQVPRDIMVINAKHLQTKVEKKASNLHELVELVHDRVRLIEPVQHLLMLLLRGRKSL
ncbi:hypothetical protein Tco_1371633, partial [Tanacetum coccineum]